MDPALKNSRTYVGIKRTSPQLQRDALPVELLSPWEQGGVERGSLVYE